MDKSRRGTETLWKKGGEENYKMSEEESQIGNFWIVLILMQTKNGFFEPTKLIKKLIIKKVNPPVKKDLSE